MRQSVFVAPLLALGFSALAWAQTAGAPTKVGIIQFQSAIVQTKDGQKAVADLNAKYDPKRKDVDKRQADLQALQEQYRKGVNTMSEEARQKLARDIDQKQKLLQRDMDDTQSELEQDQSRILQDLGQKMVAVIDKYATDHGYALIIDVSSQQTPVLYASNTIDITRDIVELYDKGAAMTTGTPAAAPATGGVARPAAPGITGGAARPIAPPAKKPAGVK